MRVPTLDQGTVLSYMYEYNSGWTQHYRLNRYIVVDPFALHCVDHITPATWRCTDSVKGFAADARKMIGEAVDFGMKNLVQIPFHGTNGSVGGIRFSNFGELASAKDIQRALPDLYYLCAFLHEAISNIVRKSKPCTGKATLSRRETEVLKWAAHGKEARVIADILKVSETTVLTHFKNIYTKLCVRTRQHAIAKALNLGLIYI